MATGQGVTPVAPAGEDPLQLACPTRIFVPAVALACAVGAVLSQYGAGLPALEKAINIDPTGSGLVLAGHFVGAACGISTWTALRRRTSTGFALAAPAMLTAVGAFGLVVANGLGPAIACATVLGTGWGGLVFGLTTAIASFPDGRARTLNQWSAGLGIGATVAPIADALAGGYSVPLVAAGAICCLALLPLAGVRQPLPIPAPSTRSFSVQRPSGVQLSFAVLFACYATAEAGVSNWSATQLIRADGWNLRAAAAGAAVFWTAMTVGRLAAAKLARLSRPGELVLWSLVPAVLVTPLVGLHSRLGILLAYALVGLAFAPVFPTAWAWMTSTLGGTSDVALLCFSFDMFGALVASVIVGPLVAGSNTTAIVVVPAIAVGGALITAAMLRARHRV